MPIFRTSNAPADPATNGWPVPQPRGPYPIGEPYDGPTERLYDAAVDDSEIDEEPEPDQPRYARRGPVAFAVVLAVIALAASGAANMIAWRALAAVGASPLPSAVAAPSVVPSEPSAAVEPSAVTSADASATPLALPSPLEPSAKYAVSYAQEPLRVQIACSAVMFLDLDEPRADAVEQASDLRYDSRCGTEAPSLSLGPGAQAGGQVTDSDTDAPGCDKAIRTSPLGPGAGVPVKKGTALCVLTSTADATARGAEAQMVLVEVTDVTSAGTASMRATSWAVP